MADDGVATKTPENDKTSKSIIPGDTPAQVGASMGVSFTRECENH